MLIRDRRAPFESGRYNYKSDNYNCMTATLSLQLVQLMRGIDTMLSQCWASLKDDVPALMQHCVSVMLSFWKGGGCEHTK